VNPRVAETLLEYHYRTNRLNLKMVSDMDIQDWKLTADTTLHFDAESILYDQMTILKKPSADCKATLVFDFVNHYCKTKALNGKLYSNGKEILQIGTTGAFSIRRHMDASLDADAIDGSLNLKIRDFPAAALNP